MNTTFKVAKNDFLKSLQTVSIAVNPKSVNPSLTYIFCQVVGEKLHLTGCNSQIQIETSLTIIDPDTDISFCVDKSIIDTLKTLPEQPLKIELYSKEHTLSLIHSTGDVKINITLDNYDKMKNGEKEISSFSLSADRLLTGLEKSVKQMANDELRPIMNGVYIDIESNNLIFVASDGHRLSKFVDSSFEDLEATSFLLHRDAVPVIIKQLQDAADDDEVNIQSNDKNVIFAIEDSIITSRLLEGRYPNYNSVIPQNNDKRMPVDSKELQTILARLNTVSNSNSRMVKIEATVGNTIFTASDTDFNRSAREETRFSCSKEISIGAKGTFLQELLTNISGEVEFYFSDPNRAMLVEPKEQKEGTHYTLLLMPMMLNG